MLILLLQPACCPSSNVNLVSPPITRVRQISNQNGCLQVYAGVEPEEAVRCVPLPSSHPVRPSSRTDPSVTLIEVVVFARCWEYRQLNVIHRAHRPSRPDKARRLGFKSKQGYVIYRIRVRRGGRKRPVHKGASRVSPAKHAKDSPCVSR